MTCKNAAIISVFVLTLALATMPLSAQTFSTFQVNGLVADYFTECDFSVNTVCPIYSVDANTSGTFGPQYFFAYDVFTFNGTQIVEYFGFGQISPSDVTGDTNNTRHVAVNIDTSQISGYANFVCYIDPNTFNATCENAPGGAIDVNFTATNQLMFKGANSVNTTFNPAFTVLNNFQATTSLATSSGTILGFTVPSTGFGQLGSGHSGEVVVQK